MSCVQRLLDQLYGILMTGIGALQLHLEAGLGDGCLCVYTSTVQSGLQPTAAFHSAARCNHGLVTSSDLCHGASLSLAQDGVLPSNLLSQFCGPAVGLPGGVLTGHVASGEQASAELLGILWGVAILVHQALDVCQHLLI